MFNAQRLRAQICISLIKTLDNFVNLFSSHCQIPTRLYSAQTTFFRSTINLIFFQTILLLSQHSLSKIFKPNKIQLFCSCYHYLASEFNFGLFFFFPQC